MLKKFVTLIAGDPNKRAVEKTSPIVDQVNHLEAQFEAISDAELLAKTTEFRTRLAQGEDLDDLLPEAFAAVREASKRTIGLRHYDVQIVGGTALHQGKIAEMRTGEGKTLVATLPLYLNALTGRGTHLVTVNDYLARRDARWMAPIYRALGLSVGVLQMAGRTENGKKAFIVDLDKESPQEDQHQLRLVQRAEAYAADITYGTNSEFGFDYLRDNMTLRLEDRVQRGHYFAIVDEADNVLIDEARTPLIISGPASEDTEWYSRMAQVVRQLRPEDYEVSERDRNVTLTEIGEFHVEELLGVALRDPDRPEDATPEQARLLGYLEQALRAQHLFRRNKDYLVQAGKIIIVDEFTGRLMPGRRWSDGLHQAVEAKEGVRVQAENVTYATITIQNYFRMYDKLAGMTGTAITEAEEFDKIYKLGVLSMPTNLEYQASREGAGLVMLEERDEQGYKYRYYARRDDASKAPLFWQRKDYPDVVYRTAEIKFRAITTEILRFHVLGRPVLVGTTSVELSDHLSNRMRAEPLRKLAQVMILRHAWMEKNQRQEDGRLIPELQHLNIPLDAIQAADLRKMSRELEISANPEDPANLQRMLTILNLGEVDGVRLKADLESGIPHQVLNARKHTEESQIIAGAGAFGAVTIATNMAGRGVDIKLGGELPEGIIDAVNRVLHRAGHENPYDLRMEERRQALLALTPDQYGLYEADIQRYLQAMDEMATVKLLGGLHVIGSERHEARRIDNQLRGRAARQGDPGSSRFYLSLEDELMRRFGGQQAEGLMQRMKIDDAVPMEVGLVSRLVEGSQTRVEGANFDIRKHLLEYDDVLNNQRQRIYAQRDRIFTKEDLSEDVAEMVDTEVGRRVPEALEDEEGPWKLLAWLDGVQPPLTLGRTIFPSYSLRLLVEHVTAQGPYQKAAELQPVLLRLAEDSLQAEAEHLLHSVERLLEGARERMQEQIKERMEAVDTFFEGLNLGEEEDSAPRGPRELLEELSGLVHLPVRLSNDEQRLLRDDPRQVKETVRTQVENGLINQALTRLLGSVERRLEEPLDLDVASLPSRDWKALSAHIFDLIQARLDKRRERLLGEESGSLVKDLESDLAKIEGSPHPNHITALLLRMPQGSRATFDKKTHRRVVQRTTRLTYTYYAASLLEGRKPEDVTQDVLKHFQTAQQAIQNVWGVAEFNRLAGTRLPEIEPALQAALSTALPAEAAQQIQTQPLGTLAREQAIQAIDVLGRRSLSEIYRQLLLAVITELWVDYLTQMEALRVAIGLEAYGQRDPLVQYKARASELFQNLLRDMRAGVIVRLFTFRPRDLSSVQAEVRRPDEKRADEMAGETAAEDEDTSEIPVDEPEAGQPTEDGTPLSRSQKRRRGRR